MADLTKLLVTVAADVSSFTRGIDRASSETSKFANSARSSLAGLSGAFAGIGAAASAIGLGIGAGEMLDVLRDFDKLKASLRTAEGSADGAARAIDRLRNLSADTGGVLAVDELAQAYVRLKNLGLDASNESLKSFANTALAQSKTLDQFVEAVADAVTGEFERLKEFGIRAKKDGETVAFTFQGVTKEVQFSAEAIQKYLTDIGNTKFGDGIANQAQTIGASMDAVGASFQRVVQTIGEAGLNQKIKQVFDFATRQVNDFNRALNAQIGSGLQAEIDALEIRKRQLAREYAAGQNIRDILGGAGVFLMSDEDMARLDREAQGVNRALADLRKQRDELNKAPTLPPIPESTTMGIQTAASGMEKVAKHAKAAKQSTVELTDAFSEFAKKNGEILPGGSFAEIIQTQQAELKKINADDITSVFEELNKKKLDEEVINPKAVEETRKLSDATRELGLTFTSAFEGAVIGGRQLSEVLKGLAQDIAGLALRKLFTEPAVDAATSAIGGFDWTGILGSVFGGFMAGGGNVSAGKAYVVGERRPELFVPSTSGSIIPSLAGLGSGGMNVQIIDQRGSGAPAIEQTRQRDPATGRETLKILVREELKAALSSGHLDKAMGLNYGVRRQGVQR
jgi:hypothetical protein